MSGFLSRTGWCLTLRKLIPLTDEILSRQPVVVYVETGCNELDKVAPFVLADDVFQYAEMLVSRGVSRVIISKKLSGLRSFDTHMVPDFNDRVMLYNQRMRYLTRASVAVDF